MTLRVLMIHEDRRGYGQGGGAETILRENTNVLRAMGHDVRWYHGGESFTDLLAAYRPDVCHVYTVHNFMGFGEVRHLQRVGWPHVWQLMDYWPFCLPEGEKVFCRGVPTNIEDVVIGSRVLGSGSDTVVTNRFARPYEGEVVTIRVQGLLPMRFTPEHPVLIVSGQSIRTQRLRNNRRKYNHTHGISGSGAWPMHAEPEWKDAGAVSEGDYVCVRPITEEREWVIDLNGYQKTLGFGARRHYDKIAVDEDMAYVLGWYLAEGAAKKSGAAYLSLGYGDDPYLPNILRVLEAKGLAASVQDRPAVHCRVVTFGNRPLSRYLRSVFGHGARAKRIPEAALLAPKPVLRSFLRGYIQGDGCHTPQGDRRRICCMTASEDLARGLFVAFLKMGVVAYINRTPAGEFTIRGKTYKSTGGFTVSVSGPQQGALGFDGGTKTSRPRFEWIDGAAWIPVREVAHARYSGRVYNLETTSHTFDVPFVTHNCGGRMLLRRYDETCSAATGLCDGECREGRAPDLYREVVNGSPIAALCPDTAAIYRRHGVRCDYVLSPGVDADFFTPAPDRRVAGRVVTSSAWPQYPTKGMHILRAAAREVGVTAHLITGQPRERVRDLLQTGDVFVFPSTYEETYGLCLAEAMSTGLACIASSVCGTRAQVEDGVNGLLVPPRDVGALADALRRLLGDATLRARLGRAARETVERDRTLAHVGERLMAVYEALTG